MPCLILIPMLGGSYYLYPNIQNEETGSERLLAQGHIPAEWNKQYSDAGLLFTTL